jgi:hypothetical protein
LSGTIVTILGHHISTLIINTILRNKMLGTGKKIPSIKLFDIKQLLPVGSLAQQFEF